MKRQALGKGLSSLIPEAPPESAKAEAGLLMLDLDRIQPSRYQPRTDFSGLEGLVESIRQNGIVQPVVVRQEGDRYHLIAGERRWRAAQQAGIQKIPAIVRKVADDRILELALIENIQRKDLNPIEEAKAYEVLLTQIKMSQADLAKRVGKERSSIANSLRLLKLPDKIQVLVSEGLVSVGHAKVILAISDAETQIKVADDVARRLLSVRETEALVAGLARRSEGAQRAGRNSAGGASVDPNVRAAEERLGRALSTKVRINSRDGQRGRVEIDFYSTGELDRLFTFLMTAEKGH